MKNKKSYRFDSVSERDTLINHFGKDYFSYCPTLITESSGYLYHNHSLDTWTSASVDKYKTYPSYCDVEVIEFFKDVNLNSNLNPPKASDALKQSLHNRQLTITDSIHNAINNAIKSGECSCIVHNIDGLLYPDDISILEGLGYRVRVHPNILSILWNLESTT